MSPRVRTPSAEGCLGLRKINQNLKARDCLDLRKVVTYKAFILRKNLDLELSLAYHLFHEIQTGTSSHRAFCKFARI